MMMIMQIDLFINDPFGLYRNQETSGLLHPGNWKNITDNCPFKFDDLAAKNGALT